MIDAIDYQKGDTVSVGIGDRAYEALREIYGTDRAVFAAAFTHNSKRKLGFRKLAIKHRLDPDA